MMQTSIQLLAFGIARDILGASVLTIPVSGIQTVGALRKQLQEQYPALNKLNALAFAVNSAYAPEEQEIRPGDEVALLPPVSGG
jgi:molybdopterin synthase sulfur carrier subunit